MVNKRLINTGVEAAPAAFDPLQNFETVTYTGNGGTQKITGYIRKGAAFNGSSSLIDLGNSAPFGDRDDIKAISGWIKTNGTTDNGIHNAWLYSVSGTEDAIDWFYVGYRPTTNRIQVYRRLDASNYAQTDATITPDTNWHHIVVQLTATEVEIYLDGTKQTTTNTNVGSGSNTSWITYGAYGGTVKSMIGKSRQSVPKYYDGLIDQVRFFNRTLDSGEVTTLSNETYASSTKSTTDIFNDGSGVALYELDEDAKDTGGTYNGTPTNVNFLGMAFQPDLVWIKDRDVNYSHQPYDSVRGATKKIHTNTTAAETTDTTGLTSFDSNGFTISTNVGINTNNNDYVAWCWKAGGAAVSNTDGSITSIVSANPDAGFSIVRADSGSSNTDTIGHGLSSPPEMIIRKRLDGTSGWLVLVDINGTYYELLLNSTAAATSASSFATSTTIETRSATSGNEYIWYCFHSVDGYQKVGTYEGNGAAVGNKTTLDFQPRFLLVKRTNNISQWSIFDSSRSPSNARDEILWANLSNSEQTKASDGIDFLSDGFQPNGTTSSDVNASSSTYLYLAIA